MARSLNRRWSCPNSFNATINSRLATLFGGMYTIAENANLFSRGNVIAVLTGAVAGTKSGPGTILAKGLAAAGQTINAGTLIWDSTTVIGSAVAVGANGSLIQSSRAVHSGSATLTTAGRCVMSGANTTTGTITQSDGILVLCGSYSGSGAINNTGGTLVLGSSSNGGLPSGTLDFTAPAGGKLVVGTPVDLSISNNVQMHAYDTVLTGGVNFTIAGTCQAILAGHFVNNLLTGKTLTLSGSSVSGNLDGSGKTSVTGTLVNLSLYGTGTIDLAPAGVNGTSAVSVESSSVNVVMSAVTVVGGTSGAGLTFNAPAGSGGVSASIDGVAIRTLTVNASCAAVFTGSHGIGIAASAPSSGATITSNLSAGSITFDVLNAPLTSPVYLTGSGAIVITSLRAGGGLSYIDINTSSIVTIANTLVTSNYISVAISGGSVVIAPGSAYLRPTINAGTLSGPSTTGGAPLLGITIIGNSASAILRPGAFGDAVLAITGTLTANGTASRIQFDSTASTISAITTTSDVALGGCGLIFPAGVTANGVYNLITSSGTMSGTLPTIITNSTGKTLVLSQVGNTLKVTVS